MDCADREVLSYIATTGGINGDIVRDLMAEAIEISIRDRGPGVLLHPMAE